MRDGHQTAAGAALDLGLGQLLLRAHELTLHLRRRSEELLHVKLSAWFHAALLCLGCVRIIESLRAGGTISAPAGRVKPPTPPGMTGAWQQR